MPDLQHVDVTENALPHQGLNHLAFSVARQDRCEPAASNEQNDARLIGGRIRHRRARPHHIQRQLADVQPVSRADLADTLGPNERSGRGDANRV